MKPRYYVTFEETEEVPEVWTEHKLPFPDRLPMESVKRTEQLFCDEDLRLCWRSELCPQTSCLAILLPTGGRDGGFSKHCPPLFLDIVRKTQGAEVKHE